MAIGVSVPGAGGVPRCFSSFENEGTYWFLFPLFEQLHNQTRQMIDLYDDAVFEGRDLDLLAQMIMDARELTVQQPEVWEVVVGIMDYPTVQEVRVSVSKVQMEALLGGLEDAVRYAKAVNAPVAFRGD